MSRDLRNQLEKEIDERIQEGRSLSLKIDQNAEVNRLGIRYSTDRK